MAIPRGPEQARFFVAILAAGETELALACRRLEERFGPARLGSPVLPFAHTDYYRNEIGDTPLRAFLAFPGDFATDDLAARKLASNRLETELAAEIGGPLPRPVNLDPGYLTHAKVVLASAKNFSHRIHLGGGIYADLTLQYGRGGFKRLPWTFPDYGSGAYDGFFLDLRRDLD